MALAQRGAHPKTSREGQSVADDRDGDNKFQKQQAQSSRRRKMALLMMFVAVTTTFYYHLSLDENMETNLNNSGSSIHSTTKTKQSTAASSSSSDNNLYPFFKSSADGSITQVPFPTIHSLENCTVSFQPPSIRKEESQWRKPFWIPSFSSSGASNPTNKGDLAKDLIGKLTGLGDHKAVKNYHMSMRKRLKRCHGISETVGCTQGHPLVPVQPETQTQNFQPKAIAFVRNFVAAFPASLTDKNIAYHHAQKQNTVSEYKTLRDEWYQSTFESWKSLLEWWSTNSEGKNPYQVAMYVPFEDLMTADRAKARAVLQQLSQVLREGGFEATTSAEDCDCIWYTTIREEWARQQFIMEYIPTYTKSQQEWIVQQLQQYVGKVNARASSNTNGNGDKALVVVLTKYLQHVQAYPQEEE